MNHALLKSVIYDQHEFVRNFQIVPRDYEFEENGNYVLVGLRRAGKSTLLYKIVLDLVASGVDWEQIIYINFEDERLSEFTVADFNDLLSVQSEMSDKTLTAGRSLPAAWPTPRSISTSRAATPKC
jgi:predicted AAA+ superfamily ATPase